MHRKNGDDAGGSNLPGRFFSGHLAFTSRVLVAGAELKQAMVERTVIIGMLALVHPSHSKPVLLDDAASHPCAACAAVANELERQMHEEWAHLQLTVRDRKRKLAADAVKEQACGEAIQKILRGICTAVKDYSPGRDDRGEVYYAKTQSIEKGDLIVVSGSLIIGAPRGDLSQHCEGLIRAHEDKLAAIMADGTDDLLTDLCITTATQCTAEAVARLPTSGMPRRFQRPKSPTEHVPS